MKYEAALKKHKAELCKCRSLLDIHYHAVIQIALEKQIPKKPEVYEYAENQFTPCCPCCGDTWNMNEYGGGMKFCWECGQAIDWSEE